MQKKLLLGVIILAASIAEAKIECAGQIDGSTTTLEITPDLQKQMAVAELVGYSGAEGQTVHLQGSYALKNSDLGNSLYP